MKANMGNADRIIKALLAITFSVLYTVESILAYILLALGAIFVLTSFLNFCPLYVSFGIKTRKSKQKEA